MPFTNKNLRATLEAQLGELAQQTEELRQQVVERAPAVRDQIVASLPDRDQLLDLRDDLFDRLPETVQDRLPEKVKPRPSRLRKVAAIGVLTGAGAAAFAILKRRGAGPEAYQRPTSTPPPAAPTATQPTVSTSDVQDDAAKTGGKTATKKS